MLTVRDLMTYNPTAVRPKSTLRRVVEIMQQEGFRQLPVIQNGKLVGIITDRDVRLSINFAPDENGYPEQKRMLDTLTVESCMTPNPVTVTPDVPAYRAAEMLSLYKFGALIVVEHDVVVGIITVSDFLAAFTEEHRAQVAVCYATG